MISIRGIVVKCCLACGAISRAIAVIGLSTVALGAGFSQAGEILDQTRRAQLDYLLRHDCGSCHGMTLQGGLGPSLQPQQLQAKKHSVESLSLIIRSGIPGTAMPPWGPILAEGDIRWLAEQLLQARPD